MQNPIPTSTNTSSNSNPREPSFSAPDISIPAQAYQPAPSPQITSTLPPILDLSSITLVGKEDSRNWSLNSKWSTACIISLMGFIAPLGSSIVVPGSGALDREFHLDSRVLSLLPVSFFVLGLGVGPFVLAPISELKGRQPVYITSSIIFVLFNIASAVSNNEASLYVLRFLAGVAGSSGPSLGAGSIVSIDEESIDVERRWDMEEAGEAFRQGIGRIFLICPSVHRLTPLTFDSLSREICLLQTREEELNLSMVWAPSWDL